LFLVGSVKKRQTEKLKTHGLRGFASVVSVNPSGGKLNNLHRVEIILDVNVPGKIPYRIEHSEYFELKNIDRMKPGMTLNILVDPYNQNKLMIIC
jgi:hypothetical protein